MAKLQFAVFVNVCPFVLGSSISQHCILDVFEMFGRCFFPKTPFIWFSTNLCVHLLFKLRIAVFVNVCLFVFGSSILLFYQMFGRCFIPKSTFIRFSKYLCVQFLSKLQFGVFLYVCPFVLGSSISQHCILDVFEMFGRFFFFLKLHSSDFRQICAFIYCSSCELLFL